MAKIKKAIFDVAGANGYDGTEPRTIIAALDALTDTLAGSDVDSANNISDAISTLSPSMGAVPSGTLSITANGENIDVTEYAAVDVAVSSGASFGALQYSPLVASAAPSVGDTINPGALIAIVFLGSDAHTPFMTGLGYDSVAANIAEGVYVTGVYVNTDDEDTVDAYVCTLTFSGQTATIATVTPWDGHVDVQAVGDLTLAFTMPDLGGLDPTTRMPTAVLVFHVYKAD